MALALKLKPYDVVQIGENVWVSFQMAGGHAIRFWIEAPKEVRIKRMPNKPKPNTYDAEG